VLGGTGFLGRHVVESALRREHEVTLFNRGVTRPELFPELERVRGDRGGDVSAIARGAWDAVLDTNGREPAHVRATARLLSAKESHYTFVSSVSAYADLGQPGLREDAPLAALDGAGADAAARYGASKAECERELRAAYGEAALVIRPGLIAGPDDGSGRLAYWAHRVRRGGRIAAPEPARRRLQFVDVRDLGTWIVDLCERGVGGVFNATHPGYAFAELLTVCRSVAGVEATVTWVTDEFLLEQGVGQWLELPLWIADPELAAADRVDVSRALAERLSFRPLAETVRGTLDGAAVSNTAGLAPERERELLAAWHAR
jgi:2'-hydroxyisoflavone reductase